jgi:glucose/arabinose dehydrogenase
MRASGSRRGGTTMQQLRNCTDLAAWAFVFTAACIAPGLARSEPLTGTAAFGDWHADKPGVTRLIRAADLPKPGATPSSANGPHIVRRPPSMLPQVPAGFKIELFADGLSGPRQMRVAPNGDIFVAETGPGRIRVLRAADGSPKPSANEIFASGLHQPFGIAFFPSGSNPQWVYVAATDRVVRFAYTPGDLVASQKPETVVAELPHGFGHSTRDIAFTPGDKRMLVSVGSESNDADGMRDPPGGLPSWIDKHPLGASWGNETDRAGVLAFDPDGRNPGVFATGIRKVTVPDVLLQPHSASLGLTFYEGNAFPGDYHGDAFAAEHGSWNRSKRTGYKVIRIHLKDGVPTGEYEDFVTGFVVSDSEVWGRPVGVAVARDGALLVSEDGNGTIWCVTH